MVPSLVDSNRLPIEGFTNHQIIQSPTWFTYPFRDAIQLDLGPYWPCWPETMASMPMKESTFLKAAWILTLRCFHPEEVIGIIYNEGMIPRPDSSITFNVRVEPSWDILSLLETLEMKERDQETISGAKSHSRHVCSAALIYITKSWQLLTPLTSLNEDLEVCSQFKMRMTSNSSSDVFSLPIIKLVIIKRDNLLSASIKKLKNVPNHLHESMLWTFRHVLQQITASPASLKLEAIDYCPVSHKRIIKSLTNTMSAPSLHCLHELILENCQRHPKRLAVCSFDGNLTYEELNNLSLRLAYHLAQLGVRPETFILSSFQKSTWAIVARLAILRAGGAYISIHSSNPPAYLNSVIQRTGSKIMLSDPVFAGQFHNTIETVIVITPEWLQTLPLQIESAQLPVVQPFNACTILFTSGSTGRPKAIVQEHRSYASAIRDYAENLGLNKDTRFLHFDDYAFDISNLEFLVPLILGGCCCVPGPMKTIQDLADNIQMLDANVAFLTPTVAIKANPEAMRNLKILCIGGEPLSKDLLNNWAKSSTKVINQFGMGEAAVCCAFNDNVHDPSSSPATIGRPSSGAIWIVDPLCPAKLMPIGAVGEILIEGPHLSRGYLDQDHQASDRTKPAGFMEDIPPWLNELHPHRQFTRLYRSGDLARWTHNGQIEYIGRKDTIVKLDGCRVDVVEVEHIARKTLTTKDAIVVDLLGVIDGKDDPCLAAFLYLSEHPENSETEEPFLKDASQDAAAVQKVIQIKEVLATSLPPYMIPTLFLLATRVPRTPSKKTDRRMIRLLSQKFYAQERGKRRNPTSHHGDSQLLPP